MDIAVASRAVAPLHGRGGLERAVSDVCTALTDRGHRVTLFTADPDDPRTAHPSLRVAECVTVPWPRIVAFRRGGVPDRLAHYPRFIRRLSAAIAAHGGEYDAAIGHGAAAAAFVPLLPGGRIRRLVVNPHGMEEFSARGLKRPLLAGQRALVRRAARRADATIALDPHLVPAVMRNLGVPRERVIIVPNGIDVARLDALVGPSPFVTEGPLIVSVGRIEPNKGLDVLAAALGAARAALPHGWRWVHIGDGAARAAVQAAIARGIAGHAELRGNLSDAEMHSLLARATLFVHPTRYEGSPIAILEAMAHGLPIVASAVGGIPDKITPGETGWLVPPEDADALGAAIVGALRHAPAELAAIGARSRAAVIAHFSLTRAVDQLLAALDALPSRAAEETQREPAQR
jgi:glycogen(starch) synthase